MEVIFVVGRVLFGGFFVLSGVRHFLEWPSTLDFCRSRGVPAPRLLLPVASTMIVVGGLSVVLWVHVLWGGLLLLGFLVPVTCIVFGFWRAEHPAQRRRQREGFLTNLALAGAVLVMIAVALRPPLAG